LGGGSMAPGFFILVRLVEDKALNLDGVFDNFGL
jgi:hypothetical protein